MLYKTKRLEGKGVESISHSYTPLMERNGLGQVGNVKPRQLSPGGVYGSRPYHGLSKYWAPVGQVPLPASLADAYINDNPRLADDFIGPIFKEQAADSGTPSFWGSIGDDVSTLFSSVFTSAVSSTEKSSVQKVQDLIGGSINPPAVPPSSAVQKTAVPVSSGKTIAGISVTTLALGGVAAFFLLRKK